MTFNIVSMLNPQVYNHPVQSIELIETHISWVVLTGQYAYKIKKPVNFGFLDFSTLQKRHTFCQQEVRLNRRLAAALYLDVVAIAGTQDKPVIAEQGEGFEYAVKMRQFPQASQLDHVLAAGDLHLKHMDAIARMVAEFHQQIIIADPRSGYGNKESVYQPVEENFTQISEHIDNKQYDESLSQLKQWSQSEFTKQEPVFAQRKGDGFIRECHGDMHLRNLLWLEDQPMAFDCIEFNPALRWIDVMSEVAFLVMDLQDRQQPELANRFLNTYLEITGDYAGLTLLPYYLCYRALVRAKVDALRLEQKNTSTEENAQLRIEFNSYLKLATGYTQRPKRKLIIMRGVSASGKTTVSQQLLDVLGAIRIRSDVERKRLFNINLTSRVSNEHHVNKIDAGLYSPQASQQTYNKLLELSVEIIHAGYSVIVDAAFLKQQQRNPFRLLAESLNVQYIIIEILAPPEILRQRIVERKGDVSDADLAVLEYQLANWQPLDEDEMSVAIPVDSNEALDFDDILDKINR